MIFHDLKAMGDGLGWIVQFIFLLCVLGAIVWIVNWIMNLPLMVWILLLLGVGVLIWVVVQYRRSSVQRGKAPEKDRKTQVKAARKNIRES